MLSISLAIPAFIAGVVFLYKGSDILVDGTSKTAMRLGISSLIISVILVGFGTSAPEFAISVGAAAQNEADISIGNIIGSCIANLFLVLGLSAVIRPISVNKCIFKREFFIVLLTTIILVIFSYFGLLDNYHVFGGIVFLLLFSAFIYFFFRCAKKERAKSQKFEEGSLPKNILFIILGIIGVVLGAYLLIESAITIADFLKIDKIIIALSMVAIGTSLPELVVSAMAALKNESDIAIGNVLGSNVFNILLILGASALFIPLNAIHAMDHLLILLGVTIISFPIFYTGRVISRIEGVFMLIIYSLFMWYIFFL